MPAQNDPLDPDWIATQEFDVSFRGFDQTQVRAYMRQLAKDLRTEQQGRAAEHADLEDQAEVVASLQAELAVQQELVAELSSDLDEAQAEVTQLQSEPVKVEPQELDSAQLTQLLGEETVRVLDSARGAAADIRAKAEREAQERTAELDKVQKEANTQIADSRKAASEDAAALRSKAEKEAKELTQTSQSASTRLVQDAKAAAEKSRVESKALVAKLTEEAKTASETTKSSANDVAAAVKQRGEEVAKATRLSAEADAETVRKKADQAISDAEAEAARLRAEAAADVETARDSAREEARLMLTEAQTLREKVLEDLVKRRRTARQQIDQAKAARDRLARALVSAGAQVDSAVAELEISIPEAKRAMENAGSRTSGTESEQTSVLAEGLDMARSKGKTLSPEKVSQAGQDSGSAKTQQGRGAVPKAGRNQAADRGQTPDGSQTKGSAEPVKPKGEGVSQSSSESNGAAGSKAKPASVVGDAKAAGSASKPEQSAEEAEADLVVDLGDEGVEAEASDDLDSIFARLRAGGSGTSAEAASTKAAPAKAASNKSTDSPKAKSSSTESSSTQSSSTESSPAVSTTKGSDPSSAKRGHGANAAELMRTTPTGPEQAEDETPAVPGEKDQLDVLPPFADRDVATTRFGPDLRRKLKRALADDQSDVLDRLRRAKQMSGDDLPSPDEQLSGFRKAAEAGLLGVAKAGSSSIGGGAATAAQIADVVERLAKDIQVPLRAKVERAVSAAGGDTEEVLEPVRAHYRDARSSSLPDLVDDAIAQAFATGLYAALKNKSKVVWVVDPRAMTSPDCFDNTLEDAVIKPNLFPTGDQKPLGGPGCRCLVLPSGKFGL